MASKFDPNDEWSSARTAPVRKSRFFQEICSCP
jgi:hypothetical protein